MIPPRKVITLKPGAWAGKCPEKDCHAKILVIRGRDGLKIVDSCRHAVSVSETEKGVEVSIAPDEY